MSTSTTTKNLDSSVRVHLESLGVEGLATANVDDAVAVRRAGATLPILLYGAQLPSGNHYLLQHDLTPTVYSAESLQSISGLATDSGRVVNVHINRLRRKVDDGAGVELIHTVRGVGYVLRAESD